MKNLQPSKDLKELLILLNLKFKMPKKSVRKELEKMIDEKVREALNETVNK